MKCKGIIISAKKNIDNCAASNTPEIVGFSFIAYLHNRGPYQLYMRENISFWSYHILKEKLLLDE